jgi:peptidoglycan/LPS O-acetylase OafA/YrhL
LSAASSTASGPTAAALHTRNSSYESSRIEALDGLRGIAIGMVLFLHIGTPYLPEGAIKNILRLCWSGVDLFFVLSGFLIGGILIRNQNSPRLFSVFYVRRALRILPLYYVTIALLLFKIRHQSGDWAPAWYYLFFTSNLWIALQSSWHYLPLSITWSLAVEEQFYLVAPVVCRFTARKNLGCVLAAGCLVPWTLRCLLLLGPDSWRFSGNVITFFRADSFAYGMLAAWAIYTAEGQALNQYLKKYWQGIISVAILGVMALAFRNTSEESPDALAYGYTALAAGYAMMVFVTIEIRPKVSQRILSHPVLRHLGRHAYFIYLWHGIIMTTLHTHFGAFSFPHNSHLGFVMPLAEVGLTWGLAILSWKFFEAPLVRLGHRFSY